MGLHHEQKEQDQAAIKLLSHKKINITGLVHTQLNTIGSTTSFDSHVANFHIRPHLALLSIHSSLQPQTPG